MSEAREALVRALDEALRGADAERVLRAALRRRPNFDNEARRRFAERFYRVLLWQGRLAYELAEVRPFAEAEHARLLLAHYLHTQEGLRGDEALSLAGLDVAGGALSDAAGGLRRAWQRGEPPWPADAVARIAARRSFPAFLVRAWVEEQGADAADALAAAMNEPGPITLRAHAGRGSRDQVACQLRNEGIHTRPTRHSPWGLEVLSPADRRANLWGTAAFRQGAFEVQDEGSQLIALACGVRPGDWVVDACAGRGGKTLALAALLGGAGRLVATDIDAAALRDFGVRARRADAEWVEARCLREDPGDGQEQDGGALPAAWQDLEGQADVVLVDAPCSSVGVLRRGPQRRWQLGEERVAAFPRLQRSILRQAARLVRAGGVLVYATCSVLRSENEEVIAPWLAEDGGFAPDPLPFALAEGAATLSLLPHLHGTDGFFLARFRRRGPPPNGFIEHSADRRKSALGAFSPQAARSPGRGRFARPRSL